MKFSFVGYFLLNRVTNKEQPDKVGSVLLIATSSDIFQLSCATNKKQPDKVESILLIATSSNLKTEVFVDVIEKIVFHISKEGIIQKCQLHGMILMKSFLPMSHKIIVNSEDNLKQDDVMKD
ncbi:AP-4 complex subunit mu-1-like isoform X2 [Parasteatoda tepidariorum]|uniref:AP-4 complex subunit mu-1-like isoform X2 n=1 Tax=Parasteatoda tepidariorum TaxID=114398 RepID=UPI0039BC90AD